jgi:hypothetical protein
MRHIVFWILMTAFISLNAQVLKRTAPFSIKAFVGIPRAVSSSMFRTAFNGVYEVGLSVNFRTFSNFYVGFGANNTHFQNNKGVFATRSFIETDPVTGKPNGKIRPYNTRLNCIGGFIKLGYDKFYEKAYISYALDAGLFSCTYQNVNLTGSAQNLPLTPTNFQAPYLQPEITSNFYTDGPLSFSILFSYGILLKKFNPKAPHFNDIQEISEKSNKLPISWINIGFGCAILLGDLK